MDEAARKHEVKASIRRLSEARPERDLLTDGNVIRATCNSLTWAFALLLVSAVLAAQASADPTAAYDASEEAGIFEHSLTWDASVHDFDGDGWDDLFVSRHYEGPARLYRNDGGHFVEVNQGTFGKKDRHECAWGDVNSDDRPDLFCNIGGGRGSGIKPKELWVQEPGGTFVNRAEEYGVENPYGRGRDVTFIDVNHDPHPDLFLGNQPGRSDGVASSNRLFINKEGQRYEAASEYGLDAEVGAKVVQAVDYDADGWDDLLVCGEERLFLYRNEAGRVFSDVSTAAGVDGPCEATLMTDVDGDGLPDLVRVARGRMKVVLQDAGVFSDGVYRRALVGGHDVAAGDVDQDGRPDLYVLQQGRRDADQPDVMLLNVREGRHFAEVAIPQTSEGRGDAVVSIDYDRNGLSDFVVLNGDHKARGPIRLIAFR